MGRLLYRLLIGLHPRSFRERFGEEMMSIFDEESRMGSTMPLLMDGLVSLFRQRVMRPKRSESMLPAAGPALHSEVPMFPVFESRPIRRSALVNGAIVSAVLFGAASFAISGSSGNDPGLLIGARYPGAQVLPFQRPASGGEATTEIKVASPPVDPLYALAKVYFKLIRVLDVLDANQDRDISAWEIVTASSPLKRLDSDHDGRLSAEECGFSVGGKLHPDPVFAKRARLEFMRMNPVLATLDADHDGEISADEIKNSSVTLRALDANHDGVPTPVELLPAKIDNRVRMILSRLDVNRDGKISDLERAADAAEPMAEILRRADRNGDGFVTATELSMELMLRDELHRQQERALRSAGYAR